MAKSERKSRLVGGLKNKKQRPKKIARKYVLEINKNQATLISHALDIYSRLEGGHLEWIFSMIEWKHYDKLPEAKPLLEMLKLLLTGYSPDQYPGVGMLSKNATAAWDLHRVIRHRLAWDDEPQGGMGVSFTKPSYLVGKEPLATIKLISDKPDTVYLISEYLDQETESIVACTLDKEKAEAILAGYQANNKIVGKYEDGSPAYEYNYSIEEIKLE